MEFVQEGQKDYPYSDNREEEAHDDQDQEEEEEDDQDEVRNIATHIQLPLSFSASTSGYASTSTNINTNNLQFMDYLSLKSGASHSEEGIIICNDNNNISNNNNNNYDGFWLCGGGGGSGGGGGGRGGGEREHMFDKVVTPSDVGKLNRLVIPKQHAEKYFPLDSAANEKGLLLNFEDRNGKSWRFRYSYWNSSQSYVMTKGWSRFVKEKKLDAGDIVSFERGIGDSGESRLYIDWRRRPHHHYQRQHQHALPNHNSPFPIDHHQQYPSPYQQSAIRWGGGGGGGSGGGPLYSLPMPQQQQHENFQYHYDIQYPYLHHQYHHHPPPHLPRHHQHQISGIHDHYKMNYQTKMSGNVVSPIKIESIPEGAAVAAMVGRNHHDGISTTPPVAPSKRLRLFGVNMEYCPKEDQDSADHVTMASLLSTTTTTSHHDHLHQHHHHHLIPSSSVSYHHQVRLPNNPSPLPITNINPAEFLRKGKSASLSFDLDP